MSKGCEGGPSLSDDSVQKVLPALPASSDHPHLVFSGPWAFDQLNIAVVKSRGWPTFSVKVQIVSILEFVDHTKSVTAI